MTAPLRFDNPSKRLNRQQVKDKCAVFRSRGLSYEDVAERMHELYGVRVSPWTVKSYCSGAR